MTNTIGRTFGIEIETVGLSISDAARALDRAGINVQESSWSSRGYTAWQVKPDGSLRHRSGRTAEIVSPVLSWGNADHYRQVETVCRVLRANGATVNRSCGLHTHVGISDLSRDEIIGVAKFYTAAQDSIDTLVSASRRGYDAEWSARMPSWGSYARAYGSRTFEDFADYFRSNGATNLGRYMTVNLQSYPDRGTVEFRQRNGSINARKILTWAGLMVSIVKAGAELDLDEPLTPYSQAGDAANGEGVYTWLTQREAIDAHALVWRDGARPVPAPEHGSLSRLMHLQGVMV